MLLGGGPYERLLALVLGFAAGGLSIACVIHDDRHRLQTALGTAAVETHRLNQRIEELEDAAWELRESDERHASILHALGDVVIRRDMEENVIYANPVAGSLFWPEQSPRPGENWSCRWPRRRRICSAPKRLASSVTFCWTLAKGHAGFPVSM
ncbi:hypothetical protein V6L77_12180 [Pannonibacter sp. Pt2-lr]